MYNIHNINKSITLAQCTLNIKTIYDIYNMYESYTLAQCTVFIGTINNVHIGNVWCLSAQ